MGKDPQPQPDHVARTYARVLKQLPLLNGRLTLEAFHRIVERSVAHRFREQRPEPSVVARYVDSLHTEDLALACACEAGDEVAWEHAMTTYRPLLYRAARALTGDDDAGRELADTLWAELYGVGHTRASLEAGQPRRSLFGYFHGRSKLSTWLRSVIAQRHVDMLRSQWRTRPLEAEPPNDSDSTSAVGSMAHRTATDSLDVVAPDRKKYVATFRGALASAMLELDPSDRLRLSAYYVQELTLAQVGHLFGEHEATASRRLNRARTRIRESVERTLRDEHQFTPAEMELCYQYVVDDPSMNVAEVLDP